MGVAVTINLECGDLSPLCSLTTKTFGEKAATSGTPNYNARYFRSNSYKTTAPADATFRECL
jgi:hypothetical protein